MDVSNWLDVEGHAERFCVATTCPARNASNDVGISQSSCGHSSFHENTSPSEPDGATAGSVLDVRFVGTATPAVMA